MRHKNKELILVPPQPPTKCPFCPRWHSVGSHQGLEKHVQACHLPEHLRDEKNVAKRMRKDLKVYKDKETLDRERKRRAIRDKKYSRKIRKLKRLAKENGGQIPEGEVSVDEEGLNGNVIKYKEVFISS